MDMSGKKTEIRLCMGSSCFSRGNQDVLNLIRDYIESHDLEEQVDFRGHLCQGNCNKGPNLRIDDREFSRVKASGVELLLEQALGLKPVDK